MNNLKKEFVKRGLTGALMGVLVLAVVYKALWTTGTAETIALNKAFTEIITIALMGLFMAGTSVVYENEKMSLLAATAIHFAVLFFSVLTVYTYNGWIPADKSFLLMFALNFLIAYAVIWIISYHAAKRKMEKLNKKIEEASD